MMNDLYLVDPRFRKPRKVTRFMLNNILHMNIDRAIWRHYEKEIIDGKIKVLITPDRGPGHKMIGGDY